jgi:CRP/FNR family cyclic AMP-dependent transcriptional regulator
MTTTSDVLRSIPLFQGMTDRSVEAIEGLAEETAYPSGALLVREGDPGDSFIVIVTGRATVDRGDQPIRELSAGDFLGEISLIDGGPRTATVTAVEPIAALVIQRDGFDRLMNRYPSVRLEILTALTQRLRERTPAISD